MKGTGQESCSTYRTWYVDSRFIAVIPTGMLLPFFKRFPTPKRVIPLVFSLFSCLFYPGIPLHAEGTKELAPN